MADQESPLVGAHECKICVRVYTGVGGRRVPMVMPRCGHTVCKECCFNLLQQGDNDTICCPFCRKEFFVDTVASLPHNYLALDVMEHLRAQGVLPAEPIDDDPPAQPQERPARDLPAGILLNERFDEHDPFGMLDHFAGNQRRQMQELLRVRQQHPLPVIQRMVQRHHRHHGDRQLLFDPRLNAPFVAAPRAAVREALADLPDQVAIAAEALAGMQELERLREEALVERNVGLFEPVDDGTPRLGQSGDEADVAAPPPRRRRSEGNPEDEVQVVRVVAGNRNRNRRRHRY